MSRFFTLKQLEPLKRPEYRKFRISMNQSPHISPCYRKKYNEKSGLQFIFKKFQIKMFNDLNLYFQVNLTQQKILLPSLADRSYQIKRYNFVLVLKRLFRIPTMILCQKHTTVSQSQRYHSNPNCQTTTRRVLCVHKTRPHSIFHYDGISLGLHI